ncbi:MAG: hypothetical protein MUF51_05035 [Vicinamibacteria bacterium]|jgi:hypothetical protein|nr:hypothetical protein [Vicinamibacteria bacterium]
MNGEMIIQILLAILTAVLLCIAAQPGNQRARWREALILAAFIAIAFASTGLWSRFDTDFLAGEDPGQDAAVLSKVARNLLARPTALFEGNMCYPEPRSLLFLDPVLGPALVVAPIRLFTDNAALLYNTALLLGLILASYGHYRLARYFSSDSPAAPLAGLWIPYMTQQVFHLQMGHYYYLFIGGFPFLLLALLRLVERPTWKIALITGLLFAFQGGTCGYWLVFATMLSILVALWAWRRFHAKRTWLMTALAGAFAVLPLFPYIHGVLTLRQDIDITRAIEWPLGFSTDLGTSFLRSEAYLWRGFLAGPEQSKGGPLFPGLLLLAFGIWGMIRQRDAHWRLLILILAVFLLLSFGPYLVIFGRPTMPMPFLLLWNYVPPFNTIRHPITFAVFALIALALLAVRGVEMSGLKRRPLLMGALMTATVAEVLSPLPSRVDRGRELPAVYRFLMTQPRGGILELPLEGNLHAKWWYAYHDLPMVNDDLAFQPRWWPQLVYLTRKEWPRRPAHQDMQDWLSTNYVRALPIRYLVLPRFISGYLRSNIEATTRTFEFLYESPDGFRVFRIRRGGGGHLLKRRFGGDELASCRMTAPLRGTPGVFVEIKLNDRLIGRRQLSADWQTAEWPIARASVVPGMNILTLEAQPESAELEIQDIGCVTPSPGPVVGR